MTLELLAHQKEGIQWLQNKPTSLLADEPGLGKSAQLILAAQEPVLVVAPAMVLDSGTWDDEIEKWAPGIDATQVSYTSLAVRNPKGKVQRDGNGYPITKLKPELDRKWGTVIGDEAHYLTGRKTSWVHTFRQLQAAQLELATGTPIPNWAHQAFVLLQLIHPEKALSGRELGSYWRWAEQWFQVGPTLWAPKAVGDLRSEVTWEQFRQANWDGRLLLRLRDDCLDLPPLTHQVWKVKMPREQARVYRQLKKDFITWLDSGEEVVGWNHAAQLTLLCKVATGLEVIDPGQRSSGKLDALRVILKDRPRPTMVVAHFQDSVEAAARVASDSGSSVALHGGVGRKRRKEIIRSFQAGNLDTLCASIELISEGLTLHQGGADQIVRIERSWRPSKNDQVDRRLHRIGVERPVMVIDLVSEGTIEERVLELLKLKTDQQMHALGTDELRGLVA